MGGGLFLAVFFFFVEGVLLAVPILLAVAFMTLVERKILAGIQRRRGPNIVGAFGLLQPFADALKLILKEPIMPFKADKWLFFLHQL